MTTTAITLKGDPQIFKVGATVKAYLRSNWATGLRPPVGAPLGSSAATATVGSDGTIAFTGLTAGAQYYAETDLDPGGSHDYRYMRFTVGDATDLDPSGFASRADLATKENLTALALTRPPGAFAETVRGRVSTNGSQNTTSGTLYVAGLVLPAQIPVSTLSVLGNPMANLTHQWACLIDPTTLSVLATTVDRTNAVWGTAGVGIQTFTLATAIGGATPGGTYLPSADSLVYVGFCETHSSGTNTLIGGGVGATASALAPILAASSTTGKTDPASLGSTAGALTAIATRFYAYAS